MYARVLLYKERNGYWYYDIHDRGPRGPGARPPACAEGEGL
jgi:hypothetical protein